MKNSPANKNHSNKKTFHVEAVDLITDKVSKFTDKITRWPLEKH